MLGFGTLKANPFRFHFLLMLFHFLPSLNLERFTRIRRRRRLPWKRRAGSLDRGLLRCKVAVVEGGGDFLTFPFPGSRWEKFLVEDGGGEREGSCRSHLAVVQSFASDLRL